MCCAFSSVSYSSHYYDNTTEGGRDLVHLMVWGCVPSWRGRHGSRSHWAVGKEWQKEAWLPFPFLFSLEPRPVERCCPHSVDLPASVKASWKHSHRHTQRSFHGDFKSHHYNNEDWQSQSQPCQLDLQTHKAIRAFHPLPQSPVSTSYCSISKSSIAFRSPDTFETREKFLTLRACKIKKSKQQNKSYTSNEIWQSSHFHCKRGEHKHS